MQQAQGDVIEVRPYFRSDGTRIEGYVRNKHGSGKASIFSGKTGKAVAGNWKSSNVMFNPNVSTSLNMNKNNMFTRGNLNIDSDLGSAEVTYSKKKGVSWAVKPSVVGIATALGTFLKNQAQKAADAPGTMADVAMQVGQSSRTATDIIPNPPPIPQGVQQAFATHNVATTLVGSAVLAASPILFPAAATPAAAAAGAAGTALITTAPVTAGLLPAAGATVARGGAIAMMRASPPGATTVAQAAVPPVLRATLRQGSATAQAVVPMVGSRGKFKVIDAAGKTLMSNLTKQQAGKMASQFGQIL